MNKNAQGQLVVALRWQGTQLAALLQPPTQVTYRDDLGTADFMPSKDAAVIFISESDILSGGGFRRRVVKFRQSNISSSGGSGGSNTSAERRVVVVQNTALTAQHFNSLQKFISIDLGLTVIPVESLEETANLLCRMAMSETKIQNNPFRMRPRQQNNPDQQLLQALTTVPGLGGQRARALLKHFGTLQALAQAPCEALEPVVGKAASSSVYKFFNGMA